MKRCVIFGAGFYGRGAFYKLKKHYEIAYYVDNNSAAHGNLLHGIEIISVDRLKEVLEKERMDIFICAQSYFSMANQLLEMGIKEYFVMLEGFLYHFDENEVMMPVEWESNDYYKKQTNEKSILFVQNTACIRTHKIAALMKKRGYKVFLLYTVAPPKSNNASFEAIYEQIYTVFTANALIDFVNRSDFDIIHSSNEPDSLTNYLLLTNKKIVFDTHDMMSLCGYDRMDTWSLEYLANTRSAGVIYTSEGVAQIAKKKFNLEDQKIFVLKNLILEQIQIETRYEKLSKKDGQIHCVYEGGIEGNDKNSLRYFEDLWRNIAACGIHIHFYSQSNYDYCVELDKKNEYFHYEGNIGSEELASEMTKYDCGLAIMNVNDGNRVLLETASPNKINEYINSGLPVLVGNVQSAIDFVERYGVGIHLDMEQDIISQFRKVQKIQIEDDFLKKNNLTMDSYGNELDKFYTRIMNKNLYPPFEMGAEAKP